MNNMELFVLNDAFEVVHVLDLFDSLIWTDRYYAYGDFEIYTPVSDQLLNILKADYYLWLIQSGYEIDPYASVQTQRKRLMIIEDVNIVQNEDEGHYLLVTGRSLESILDRRIVWNQTILSGNFQNEITRLITENIIAPIDHDGSPLPDRKITNFNVIASTDPRITSLTIDAQIARGKNLYEVISELCISKNLGYKITLDSNNQYLFMLYFGENRSYEQTVNPYVVFSPNYDNLINADYAESKKPLKTVTMVAGEGEENVRKTTIVGSGTGVNRRELYTDANDLSQNNGETVLTDEEYLAMMIQRGEEDLSKHGIQKTFESEIDTLTTTFKYREDYLIGDVVQIDSNYGVESRARVTEIIHSQSKEGISIYPTLQVMDVTEVASDGVLIPGAGGGSSPGSLTPTELLNLLLTVDGHGSGLDADTLDGKQAIDFMFQKQPNENGITHNLFKFAVLAPVPDNKDNWYRICSFSGRNTLAYTRFIFHSPGMHTKFMVEFSNGAGGDNVRLKVRLLGHYSYYDRMPWDWRIVIESTNQPSHVEVRFPFIINTHITYYVSVLEQIANDLNQISYPMTNSGSVTSPNFHGIRMGNMDGVMYEEFKLKPGYYQRTSSQFVVTNGAVGNDTIVI